LGEQDYNELLQRLMESGVIEMGSSKGSQKVQEILDDAVSDHTLDQDKISTTILNMTSDLSEDKRRELKEFVEQALQQLDSEQLTDEILKILYLFLDQD
jgi:chaperonin GroEL (HSP60 family)